MGGAVRLEPTDAQQIELSTRQPQAFTSLFERHAASVHRYLVKRVGHQYAEDLVGETFATAFRSRTNFDLSHADARPWLFGIATNLARHFWRSEGRRQSRDTGRLAASIVPDPSEDATTIVFFSEQQGVIGHALAQLDDAHLDVLLLVAGPGLTYEEVSIALGIPIGTVRSRMSRARERLRELLGGSGQYLDGELPTEERSMTLEGKNER